MDGPLFKFYGKKIDGMEIKFMSHDCIAKTIFPGFQWEIQNILYV